MIRIALNRSLPPRPRTTHMAFAALALLALLASTGPPAEAAQARSAWAITNATVITAPGTTIDNATVVLRDGLIAAVGADVTAPADARVIDGAGMTVYAGWIDAASEVAVQASETEAPGAGRGGRGGRGNVELQMLELGAPGVNDRVHPDYLQAEHLTNEDDDIDRYRNVGFTTALVVPQEGIYRGQSVLLALRDADPADMIVAENVTQTVGFSSGGFGRGYPSSSMGVTSLIRQVLLDTQRQATWENSYANDPTGLPRPEANPAYTALMPVLAGDQAVMFDASNTREAKRALSLAQEFSLVSVIKGNGNEYEIIDILAAWGGTVIVPLDYPDRPGVSDDPDANLDLGLDALRRWEEAPGNAAALENAGIPFAFTTDGVSPDDFTGNVRRAIEAGLSENAALAALTTTPAELFGVSAVLGTIEPGKIANVVVATGSPFAEDTQVRHVFVDGIHSAVEESSSARGGRGGRGGVASGPADPRGTWAVTLSSDDFALDTTWRISGEPGNLSGTVDGEPFNSVELDGDVLTVDITSPMGQFTIGVTVSGDSLNGSFGAQGFTMDVNGRRTSGPGPNTMANGEQQ